MKQLLSESFLWAEQLYPILKQFENDGVSYYKVVASTADVKNRNGRVYTSDELTKAAASLSERPLNINHELGRALPFPENQVVAARFEDGLVECIIQVADEKTNQMIQDGQINAVSIEGLYLDGSKNSATTEFPTSLHFQALALLTTEDEPGDKNARILREHRLNPYEIRIDGSLLRDSVRIPEIYGETMSNQELNVKDADMSTADINSLPDDAFAYIENGGKKDDQGKTTPRSLRHLPYRGKDGKPDAAHVRNALARLPQTDIPDAAKAEANKKLQAAAKELGIETQQMQAKESGLSLKIDVDTSEANRKIDLLEKRIYKLQTRLRDAGLKDDAADDSDPDRDAVVDPTRNEDGTFHGPKSLQAFSDPQASQTSVQNVEPVQNTKTNVEIGRDIPEGNPPKMIQSPQNSTAAQITKPKMNDVGVGNPESTVKPKMDYPQETNPLGITNQNPSPIADGMKVTKASSLMDALTNAGSNVSVKIIPTGVFESKTHVTNQSEKIMSTQEGTQSVKESVSQPISVSVKLEGASEIKQAAETLANVVKESQTPKPQAKVSGTETTQKVEESFAVKEAARLNKIASVLRAMVNVREDISATAASGALGQIWSPDMIVLPPDLPANLRRFVQVKEIPKGSKQINFTTVSTAEFGSITEDTSPSDATQTITEISATPTETGVKQRISYIVLESATPDVVQAIERSQQAAALIDEDAQILNALDSATPYATYYASTATSESQLTTSMTFTASLLAQAFSGIQTAGYALNPGDLVCVMHPVQYQALLQDSHINQYLYFGSAGAIQQGVVPQVYGIDIVRSTKVPTGTGSGSPAATTYHAQVFLKASAKGDPNGIGIGGSVGLGIQRELMIEQWRRIDERALYLVASHRIAAAVIQPNAVVHLKSC
ncbi:MAG: phage major capsid protein [Nitrososphaerota archaeon]|nr:phage major capsid protein [Nitrososphaerota archaeon]